jgi:hypothetical protein
VNPDRVDCFLDTEKIGIGREWQQRRRKPGFLRSLWTIDTFA